LIFNLRFYCQQTNSNKNNNINNNDNKNNSTECATESAIKSESSNEVHSLNICTGPVKGNVKEENQKVRQNI